jgi:hypothetical protein
MARINRKYSEPIEELVQRGPKHKIYSNKLIVFWKVAAYSGWILLALSNAL